MPDDSAIESLLRSFCSLQQAGARLPSTRDLQKRFAVSPLTVQSVIKRLSNEGLVTTRPGDGSFVSRPTLLPAVADLGWQAGVLGRAPIIPGGLDHLRTPTANGTYLLDSGFPDATLQAHSLLSKAAQRAAKQPTAWDRCLPEGLLSLRTHFANELGPSFTAADVVITPGVQAAIDSVFRSFSRPGDSILMEQPSYPGAIASALFAGLTIVPIPTDADGIRTELVETAAERTGARIIFVQPRHSNPTGSVLSDHRRQDLLDIAHRRGMFIVEDDWVRDLDFGASTPPPIARTDEHGHVIYLRSISKVSAPGIRIGAVIARGPAAARLRAVRTIADFFASPLLQLTVQELFADRGWERHLQTLRNELRERRDALAAGLRVTSPTASFTIPTGGVALWVRLPLNIDELSFVAECKSRGVAVSPGCHFWISEPEAPHVRISFATASVEALADAARRIGNALDSIQATTPTS